jgi:UDP-N-acetylglucosamine--N-acetylmuramyl-(pentapeptide) pyrophosphoryl-undecaprenol N-acetylglucosamine transferase
LEILHVCGKGQREPTLDGLPRYRALEYLSDEFPDALARADVVVSRAGAHSLAELLALSKPALLVPLPSDTRRGDQIKNARVYAQRGYGLVLPQNELTPASLDQALRRLLAEAVRSARACSKIVQPMPHARSSMC